MRITRFPQFSRRDVLGLLGAGAGFGVVAALS
jgi:hypothetical protein